MIRRALDLLSEELDLVNNGGVWGPESTHSSSPTTSGGGDPRPSCG